MEKITSIFNQKNLFHLPGDFSPEQGNLNTVIFVRDGEGKKLVLRIFRADKRDEIKAYLSQSYNAMGVARYGAEIKYRDIEEQVRFMTLLESKGVPVPHVIDHDSEWILMELLEGAPLKEQLPRLSTRESGRFVRNIVLALMDVHKKGECLWDRWGGNELVSAHGSVRFIDFDIDVEWPERISKGIKTSFDLSVMVRACVQFSLNKKIAAKTISALFRATNNFSHVYDINALKDFFEGQIGYYDRAYCRNSQSSLQQKKEHYDINEAVWQISKGLPRERSRTSAPNL